MRNELPLPRLQIPVEIGAVSVPSITTDSRPEVGGEDDDFGLERRETASGSEPESPEDEIEDVVVPRIALLDIADEGAEEGVMEQAPEPPPRQPLL
jgi:hypothetical protein